MDKEYPLFHVATGAALTLDKWQCLIAMVFKMQFLFITFFALVYSMHQLHEEFYASTWNDFFNIYASVIILIYLTNTDKLITSL